MKKLTSINKLIFLLNNGFAILLLLSLLVPLIKPTRFPLAAMLGLLTPALIVVNALFLLYWIIIGFRRQLWLSGLTLVLCILLVSPVYKFSSSETSTQQEEISILSYNVRKFNIYDWIDDTEIPVTCVVWNPHRVKARKMTDFGSAEWQEVIGVQPGILERQMLQPMQTLVFEYQIKLLAGEGGEGEAWSRDEPKKE